jgi:protein O-GlcNAc transferase
MSSKRSTAKARKQLPPALMALENLLERKDFAQVEVAARRVLSNSPQNGFAIKALSTAVLALGRLTDAEPLLRHCIRLFPQDPESHSNLGVLLSETLRWKEAIQSFNEAIRLAPKGYVNHKNLGFAYVSMHEWGAAVPPLLKAIELHPDEYPDAVAILCVALTNSRLYDEAAVCLKELLKVVPQDMEAAYRLAFVQLKRCEWAGVDELIEGIRAASDAFSKPIDTPFYSLAFPSLTAAEQMRLAQGHAKRMAHDLLAQAELVPLRPGWQGRKIRVGYLSADLREHPVGYVLPDVIENHDVQRFDTFAYSMGPNDRSAIRQRLEKAFAHFVDIRDLSIHETVQRIRQDQIDVLVDLQGWTAEARVEALALRCAPVQVSWLGYAGTLGHSGMTDYIIGDPVVTPLDHQEHFAERIAQLPFCYLPLDCRTQPAVAPSRTQAGLPDDMLVLCSLNNSYKFNRQTFDVWCDILREVPNSVLWLSDPGQVARDHLSSEAERRQVGPGRLLFAPRVDSNEEHLARLSLSDLALDTYPYNSHSSGIHALWAGVPMVTRIGSTFASRVGASLVRSAGLGELVAADWGEYHRLVVSLASDRKKLAELREHLIAGRQHLPVFDMPALTRGLEDLFQRMLGQREAGVSASLPGFAG